MELSMHTLLSIAKENHASDVHITVGVRPKCRISGTLYEMDGFERLTPAMTQQLVESMFGPKQKQTMEEVGEVDFAYSDPSIGRFRVNAFHQRGSYAAVLRIVASDIPAPDQLGVPESVLGLTKKKRGLVLVTGPTGSGKSTTLASLIDVINKERNEHIITLEDPIEYLHKHIRSIVNQREIGLDTDSYGNALRAALREDPDIILVGEMRDFDTISTAITAAETWYFRPCIRSARHRRSSVSSMCSRRISRTRSVRSLHRFWRRSSRSSCCRPSMAKAEWRRSRSCSGHRRSRI